MGHELTDRDRERFDAIRDRLEGVSRGEVPEEPRTAEPGPLDPMLATTFDGNLEAIDPERFVAERKFDGTRLLLQKFDGDIALFTRRHVERSETFPDLVAQAASTLPDGIILDGEYTFLTSDGQSHFRPIHARDNPTEHDLEPTYFVFDVLAFDGQWCTREPFEHRRERLEDDVPLDAPLDLVEVRSSDFQSYFEGLVSDGEEGIMLKRRSSPYHIGTRSDRWQKVKAFTETDVVAVGFTSGEGRRAETFGSLVMTDGDRYVGRVGSGFSESELESLRSTMTPVETQPVPVDLVGEDCTPVEPLVVQVKYQNVTESGQLRAPVFLRQRPEKPIEDVTAISDSTG